MEKEFIPYEQALALKELGFDETSLGFYYDEKRNIFHNSLILSYLIAPLYQQAFRWFREKYGLFVAPSVISYESDPYLWFFEINSIVLPFGTDLGETSDFKTYEEAELECLKKLIEIVKEK